MVISPTYIWIDHHSFNKYGCFFTTTQHLSCSQGLALSTFQVVLVPTLVGVLVNEFAPGFVRAIKQFLPLVGVFLTTMLCASPVGQVADVLRCVGVLLLH